MTEKQQELFNQSYKVQIASLVIYGLGGGHTHTHTYDQVHAGCQPGESHCQYYFLEDNGSILWQS